MEEDEEFVELRSLLMRLMKSLGMSSKGTGECVSFLFTKNELKWMLSYLIEYQDTTEAEVFQIVALIRMRYLEE